MIMRYEVSEHVVAREIADETVILDLAHGSYLGLETTGARVWQLLDEGKTLKEICGCILDEYDVSIDVVERDVQLLVDELEERGLIKPTETVE